MNAVTPLLAASLLSLTALPLVAVAAGLFGGLSSGSPSGISPDGSQINTLDSVGGALFNKYGKWEFGPGVSPPTGASQAPCGVSPVGPFGSFNYVKLNGRVINQIAEFGIGGRTGASQIVVNYGGEVFFLTTENDRLWYQFYNYNAANGGAGSPCIDPSSVVHNPGPNSLGPFTPSAPGSTISNLPGCVTSVDGVWCNGAGGTSWAPTLNGIPFDLIGGPPPRFNSLTIQCNGNLFGLSDDNRMYSFLSFAASESNAVSGPGLPTCPIAISVAVTPNPALVSGSIPGPQITAGTSSGVVASFAVTMSDGSAYAGTPTFMNSFNGSAPATFLGISGSNIVLTGAAIHGVYFVGVQTVAGQAAAGPWVTQVVVN